LAAGPKSTPRPFSLFLFLFSFLITDLLFIL
jgi:hypothetical protein